MVFGICRSAGCINVRSSISDDDEKPTFDDLEDNDIVKITPVSRRRINTLGEDNRDQKTREAAKNETKDPTILEGKIYYQGYLLIQACDEVSRSYQLSLLDTTRGMVNQLARHYFIIRELHGTKAYDAIIDIVERSLDIYKDEISRLCPTIWRDRMWLKLDLDASGKPRKLAETRLKKVYEFISDVRKIETQLGHLKNYRPPSEDDFS